MSQLSKIRTSIRQVKDPVIRERLLMVQASYNESLRDASKTFGCTHGKIDYWKKRYEKEGLKGLYTKPRSGRPPKISKGANLNLKQIVSKHDMKRGWRTKRIRQLIYEETGVRYSERQVIRITQSWGLAQIKPRPRYAYSKQEDREAFIKKPSLSGP